MNRLSAFRISCMNGDADHQAGTIHLKATLALIPPSPPGKGRSIRALAERPQASDFFQRGQGGSLSWGRGLGGTAVELRYGVWKARPRRGLNVSSRGCNPRCKRGNRYRPRRGRTTHDNGLVRPLPGRNPFIVPIRGLPPTAIQILPLRGMKYAAKFLSSTSAGPAVRCAMA
jgi:hypothetical protein